MIFSKKNIDELVDILLKIDNDKSRHHLILIGESCEIDISRLSLKLNSLDFSFCGCKIPGILSPAGIDYSGIIIKSFPGESRHSIINQLPQSDKPYDNSMVTKDDTLFVFIDNHRHLGSTNFLYNFCSTLSFDHNILGSAINDGSDNLARIFDNNGIYKNAALILPVAKKSNISVQHGFEVIAGPLVANNIDFKEINQLNWEPSFNVYINILKEHLRNENRCIEDFDDLQDLFWSFPIGEYKEDKEDLVRDTIYDPQNPNTFKTYIKIEEDTMINVMGYTKESLFNAVKKAVSESLYVPESSVNKELFVIDCISRAQLLKKDFYKEIDVVTTIQKENRLDTFEGILSYGEIVSVGNKLLELYNKTLISACFYD